LTHVPKTGTIVPIMGTDMNPDKVSQGLFGQTRTAILSLLYGHADESFYLRQLVRETGAGHGAIQREVKQLSDAGLIVRKTVGRQIFYQANRKSPVFAEVRGLLLKTSGVHDVLREALAPLKNRIKIAFIYGSIATQKDRSDSDIDLMIVGDAGLEEIVPRLSNAEKRLRREINPAVYPPDEFRSKAGSGNHFLNSVLRSRKLFILGNEDDLRELSTKQMAGQASKQPGRNQKSARRR
jgi:predicted nucleotidyltransferase